MIYCVDFDFELQSSLAGHEGNVCCLDAAVMDGSVVVASGSWDKTAVIWKDAKLKVKLVGHDQAVWAVKILKNGNLLTGSADKTIKLWDGNSGKCLWTFEGHLDCVRGVAVDFSESLFYSISNDASIKIWDMNGDCLHTLYSHSSFLYSVAISGELLFTVGEDKCIKVWKDQECVQTIPYPCESIWTVAVSPKSDIVVGGSDGYLRLFSCSPLKNAAESVLAAFQAAVSSIQIHRFLILILGILPLTKSSWPAWKSYLSQATKMVK